MTETSPTLNPSAKPQHSSTATSLVLQRISTCEALKPGSPLSPESRALQTRLWTRTFLELGQERFDAAMLRVLQDSTYRPDIAEIRRAAGIPTGSEALEAEAMQELRVIFDAMRFFGTKLKRKLGAVLNDGRDEHGRPIAIPNREPETPAPTFSARTEAALVDMGRGARQAGIDALSLHPAISLHDLKDDAVAFRNQLRLSIESQWLDSYRRAKTPSAAETSEAA